MELQNANEFTFVNQQSDGNYAILNPADEFVFNIVQGDVLSTIDQDTLKVTTEEMYSDLIPIEAPDLTTLVPVAAPESPEWSTSSDSSSWAVSPESLTSIEDIEATMYSPESYMSPISSANSPGYETSVESQMLSPVSSSNSEESITLVVSPGDVFGEQAQAPPRKKRGRKPKSDTGEYAPRPKKLRKTKVYEIEIPFEDKEKERKRLNAQNAKRHRDMQKQQKEDLEKQLQEVKNERDLLKNEVESLRKKEVNLSKQLEVFKAHFGKQAISVVTLLQAGQVSF